MKRTLNIEKKLSHSRFKEIGRHLEFWLASQARRVQNGTKESRLEPGQGRMVLETERWWSDWKVSQKNSKQGEGEVRLGV